MKYQTMYFPSEAFKNVNSYYDLLYHDKDYEKETAYIIDLIKEINSEAKHILELGSGTGNYSRYLCKAGFRVTGIELSEQMAHVAKTKSISGFEVLVDNITSFELDAEFDAAVSLFHVISYLTKEQQVLSCLKQVHKHLKPKGVFIFDVWYTPAVYSIKPQIRVKRCSDSEMEITRIAEPTVLYQKNIVEVDYQMFIKNKPGETYNCIKEKHSMRHFSTPEIELMAKLSGFKVVRSESFLTAQPPSNKTWGVCYVLQKV